MTDIEQLLASAKAMRDRRAGVNTVQVLTTSPMDLLSAARAINEKRKPSMEPPKPIPVKKFAHYKKAFVCKDNFGLEICVWPSDHALEQFARRYNILDHFFNPQTKEEAEAKMREVFNKGHLTSNMQYAVRNRQYKHNGGREIIAWTSGNINFIVNSKETIILTAELIGEFRKYNT